MKKIEDSQKIHQLTKIVRRLNHIKMWRRFMISLLLSTPIILIVGNSIILNCTKGLYILGLLYNVSMRISDRRKKLNKSRYWTIHNDFLKPLIIKEDIIGVSEYIPNETIPKEGDIIMFKKYGVRLISRIYKIFDDGIFVQGDNPHKGFDSRTQGLLNPNSITHFVEEVIHVEKRLGNEYSFFLKNID